MIEFPGRRVGNYFLYLFAAEGHIHARNRKPWIVVPKLEPINYIPDYWYGD